ALRWRRRPRAPPTQPAGATASARNAAGCATTPLERFLGARASLLGEPRRQRPTRGPATRPLRQERLGCLGVKRTGEEEALPAVALLLTQQRELARLLDALRDRLDRESLAELNERANEGLAFLVVSEPRDERAVDLQGVDRKLAQVREGGVAGAKVVDRDT